MLKIEPVATASQIAGIQQLLRGYFSWFLSLSLAVTKLPRSRSQTAALEQSNQLPTQTLL
jgi:hypothetical protein